MFLYKKAQHTMHGRTFITLTIRREFFLMINVSIAKL